MSPESSRSRPLLMIFNKYEDFGKTLTVLIVKNIGKNDQACAHLSNEPMGLIF